MRWQCKRRARRLPWLAYFKFVRPLADATLILAGALLPDLLEATVVLALVDLAGVRLACLVDFATALLGAALDLLLATAALYGTCSSSF